MIPTGRRDFPGGLLNLWVNAFSPASRKNQPIAIENRRATFNQPRRLANCFIKEIMCKRRENW